jgi:hypothetical protein
MPCILSIASSMDEEEGRSCRLALRRYSFMPCVLNIDVLYVHEESIGMQVIKSEGYG